MELVLAEPMPEVCSEHGLPASGHRPFIVHDRGPFSEFPTLRVILRSALPRERSLAAARLRFSYPVCELCRDEIRRSRWIAVAALLAIPLTIAAVLTVASLELRQLYVPLAFAVMPGCMPIALLVVMLGWSRAGYFADVWMNQDGDQLIVSAHPDFVAAVERNRAETQ
ncbi:hypothetical protein [Nocardia sp. NPDC058497]|uniref:hypothetical protein n=1 Tax=Nocardia sp. NPDC058497 TaxID=3346529 RepID=UPI00364FAF23